MTFALQRPHQLPSELFAEDEKVGVHFAIGKAFYPDWRASKSFRAKCGAITLYKTHDPDELLRVLERTERKLGWL